MDFLCLCLVVATASSDAELMALVERHREGLELIHTLEVEIERKVSRDGGISWESTEKVLWRKDGERQRFISTSHGFMDIDGKTWRKMTAREDLYNGPTEYRSLRNWNPENPPPLPLTPKDGYRGVVGAIAHPARSTAGLVGATYMLNFVATLRHTLTELAPIASHKKLLGKVDLDSGPAWAMEFQDPDFPETYTLYLDPAKNYAIAQREVRAPPSSSRPAGSVGIHKVLEFRESKPGIYFPVHVRVTADHLPDEMAETWVTLLRVNEPLSEDAFEIPFPSGVPVYDRINDKIYIWGDGEPERTFSDSNELADWEMEVAGFFPRSAPAARKHFVWLTVGVLLLVAAIVILRRRYAGKVH